ncbi:methylglyoxal synthase-like protein [Chaetoceros tenuissimus]|uniref:Methylglyoxal synthase-like protein n=1 Tax=Chaetoceros tenuissimus TaxID=426638 RepID=A0AAD3DB23_9STRA|nr:methylglyoxal synthase-like protein [Chaetoceros tenuissimus]
MPLHGVPAYAKKKENMFLRASTARIKLNVLSEKMNEMIAVLEKQEKKEVTATGNTVKYDLSKNVLEYLPIVIPQGVDDEDDANSKDSNNDDIDHSRDAKKLMKQKSKFLGLRHSIAPEKLASITSSTRSEVSVQNVLDMDPEFDSFFGPNDMRLMALVSHNNMKHAMREFVEANKNVLKKFRLTGTNTTMSMLREVFGDDPEVIYGPSCKSGPLGGDAQLVAMAVTGELGGCIFFIDPMDAHPHSADIECLVRQGNVHNIMMLNNPTTAHIALNAMRVALKMGRVEMIPSFFFDLESPSVEAYKQRQNNVLNKAVAAFKKSARERKVDKAMKDANALWEKDHAMKEKKRASARSSERVSFNTANKYTSTWNMKEQKKQEFSEEFDA